MKDKSDQREVDRNDDVALAYEVQITAHIDLEIWRECYGAEGGHIKPPTKGTESIDDSLAYTRCLLKQRPLKHSHREIEQHLSSQGLEKDGDINGVWNTPAHSHQNKEGMWKHIIPHVAENDKTNSVNAQNSKTKRRLTIFVDAHNGQVIRHLDRDLNKFQGM
jgi:hypothetical protein